MIDIKINGLIIKTPAFGGLKISNVPVWSSNKGTSASGKTIGDIIRYRRTISMSWQIMTEDEMQCLCCELESMPFFDVTFTDEKTKEEITIQCENGGIDKGVYSYTKNLYADVSATLIER